MPYYEYECAECEYTMELHYKSNAPARVECPKCGAMARRVFSPPTVIQNGYSESDARFNRGRSK